MMVFLQISMNFCDRLSFFQFSKSSLIRLSKSRRVTLSNFEVLVFNIIPPIVKLVLSTERIDALFKDDQDIWHGLSALLCQYNPFSLITTPSFLEPNVLKSIRAITRSELGTKRAVRKLFSKVSGIKYDTH